MYQNLEPVSDSANNTLNFVDNSALQPMHTGLTFRRVPRQKKNVFSLKQMYNPPIDQFNTIYYGYRNF